MKQTNFSAYKYKLTLWLLGVVLVFSFLPNLMYLGVKFEFFKLTPPVKDILGVELKLKDGWFPYSSGKISIWLDDNNEVAGDNAIYYYKNDWLNPWSSSLIVVSKSTDIMAKASVEERIKNYCSTAHCNFSNPIKPLGYYDPRYGLTFTISDKDGLNNILSIKAVN